MTDEEFFERLRDDAQQLRYEPADDALWTRLQARVTDRVRMQPGIAQSLASWFRPVATALAVLSIIAALSVEWIDRPQQPTTIEAMAAAPSTDVGEALGVQ
jgi:hypothetical protein